MQFLFFTAFSKHLMYFVRILSGHTYVVFLFILFLFFNSWSCWPLLFRCSRWYHSLIFRCGKREELSFTFICNPFLCKMEMLPLFLGWLSWLHCLFGHFYPRLLQLVGVKFVGFRLFYLFLFCMLYSRGLNLCFFVALDPL